jgi:hypothetical protein
VALAEVRQVDTDTVRKYVGPAMEHADAVCCSMEELAKVVREWCRASDDTHRGEEKAGEV